MGTPVEGTSSEGNEQVQDITPDQGDNSGPNPAWNDVLNIIPQEFHSQITPHFQKWDQAANSRVTSANEAAAKFKDYEPFVEHGITRDQLIEGLQLMHTLNNNPRELYESLQTSFGFTPQQAAAAVEEISEESEENSFDIENHPKFQELQNGFQILAQRTLDEQQRQEEAKMDALLDKEFSDAKKKYGDFDEAVVGDLFVARSMMNENYTVDQAVQDYQSIAQSILGSNPRPFAPNVMGATSGNGAGLPSQQTDVTKLSDGETKNLVAEILKASAQQNR